MAAYVDLTYYKTTYLGTAIADADLPRLALRASAVIDSLTFGRAAPIVTAAADAETIEKIKMATCAVADELQKQDQSDGTDGIQSESIGSNSVTYAANSSKALTNETKQNRAAKVYLGLTGLMYRGFASGEYGGSDAN